MNEVTTVAAAPVGVPSEFKLSKTQAREIIGQHLRHAGFQNLTTADDKSKGHERWRVYAIGDYGRRLPLVEVNGKPDLLPKAILVAALRAIHIEVEFKKTDKGHAIGFKPIPLKAVEPAP